MHTYAHKEGAGLRCIYANPIYPIPQFDNVLKPQLQHRAIDTQPFNFEEWYHDKPTRETLVQQILQKEKVLHLFPRIFIVTAPVNNFETGGMCKSYCYIIWCCTYILYTLSGSQNSECGLCQTAFCDAHEYFRMEYNLSC